MDGAAIFDFLKEIVFLLAVFGLFLMYALAKGKQSLINLIMGLYLGLLLSVEFPYYGLLLGSGSSAGSESAIKLVIFAGFAIFSTVLFGHLMPREFDETAFEGFGKKALFALGGTVLVMAFSFHVLPVTEFLTPGTPIQYLFAPEQGFFWWLIAPLAVLFLL